MIRVYARINGNLGIWQVDGDDHASAIASVHNAIVHDPDISRVLPREAREKVVCLALIPKAPPAAIEPDRSAA